MAAPTTPHPPLPQLNNKLAQTGEPERPFQPAFCPSHASRWPLRAVGGRQTALPSARTRRGFPLPRGFRVGASAEQLLPEAGSFLHSAASTWESETIH